ncbi:MAG: DUF58 domain-containing protein [Candidatus Brocadiae bacterium]|nr:DUF58 domain-containing protein [Candidatus Brocadiia bacterium]
MAEQSFLDKEFMNQLEQLSLFSRKVFRGLLKGERRSKKKGVSIEFADYRDYTPGDDLRFLDWNIYGRLERLLIKLFQEEEDLNIYFLLDRSPSMKFGSPEKFLFSKKLLAALAYIGLINLDRVAVGSFCSDLDYFFPLSRGKQSVWRLFEFLESIPCASGGEVTDLYKSCRSFATKFKSSSMVILLSDFMNEEGFEKALSFFATASKDTFLFHILSQEEINPALAGDLRLVDSETLSYTDVSISDALLKKYQAILRGYIQKLHDWSNKHDIFYSYTSNKQSFEDLVMKYLREIGMLR